MTLFVGLISGTSADGVDAALVDVRGRPGGRRLRVLAGLTLPYPAALRLRVLAAQAGHASVSEVARLDAEVGEVFARAAHLLLRRARVAPARVRAIGSHGQTLVHLPRRTTLQVGEPAVIAARTGIDVVADFRPADIAAGGEGAPLAPLLDLAVLGPAAARRGAALAALNLGGIANLTHVVPARGGRVRHGRVRHGRVQTAFDAGPANALLDEAARRRRGRPFDAGGRTAARGRVDHRLLAAILRHPYLRRPPPKSTGKGTFGPVYLDRLLRGRRIRSPDLLATLAEATARLVADAVRRWCRPPPAEVVVSGGGARNVDLIRRLARALAPIPLVPSKRHGLDPALKEAALCALLAAERLAGAPTNVPAATGARRSVSGGAVWSGRSGLRND